MLSGFTTIAFYPIFDLFMSIMNCKRDKKTNLMMHVNFEDVECWNGIHILHVCFAFLAAILFLIIALTSALCYYECKSSANVPGAKENGRGKFMVITYIAIMSMILTFMNSADYVYMILVLI
jgi:hypothetical protein